MGEDKLTGPRGGGRMICTDDGIGRGGGGVRFRRGMSGRGGAPGESVSWG